METHRENDDSLLNKFAIGTEHVIQGHTFKVLEIMNYNDFCHKYGCAFGSAIYEVGYDKEASCQIYAVLDIWYTPEDRIGKEDLRANMFEDDRLSVEWCRSEKMMGGFRVV